MKISEMREMPVAEAKRQVIRLKSELAKERALVASGTRKENSGKIRGMRKDIARLLTVINEKIKAGEKDVEVGLEAESATQKYSAGSAVKGLAHRFSIGGKKAEKKQQHVEKPFGQTVKEESKDGKQQPKGENVKFVGHEKAGTVTKAAKQAKQVVAQKKKKREE